VGGGVRVWRVDDGKEMATVETRKSVVSLAVSKDRRWIAAGTGWGDVFVWNAETYEKVFWHRLTEGYRNIHGVDFSPDSSRLVSASHNQTAIWDIATCKRLQTLDHGDWVRAAKYSPQGDRIATATVDSVRVYDSNDGRLLMDTPVKVAPWFNTGLLWFNDHIFVISDSKIKRLEASTGSAVSEWPVPDSTHFSCIMLPKHGEFIAYSTQRTITFWDTATHTQLGLIQHPQDIRSIAVSPDDRLLAIGGDDGKITINSLFRIVNSIPLSPLHPTFQEPDIQIDDNALHSWKHNQLANAETLLTTAIHESRNPSPHALASRALVRARLRQWDASIADATEVFVRYGGMQTSRSWQRASRQRERRRERHW